MWWKSNTGKAALAFAAVGVLAVAAFTLTQEDVVIIRNNRIAVEIVRTQEGMQKGLSGRPALKGSAGMLFWYDQPLQPSFWMKDMQFSIDIIWITSDWRIAEITSNAALDSFPETFSPSVPIQYVLEVNAFWAKDHLVSIGDRVELR